MDAAPVEGGPGVRTGAGTRRPRRPGRRASASIPVGASGPWSNSAASVFWWRMGARGCCWGPSPAPPTLSHRDPTWREAEAQPEMFQQKKKKKDTVVLSKLFWPEHFRLGSRRVRGPPVLSWLPRPHRVTEPQPSAHPVTPTEAQDLPPLPASLPRAPPRQALGAGVSEDSAGLWLMQWIWLPLRGRVMKRREGNPNPMPSRPCSQERVTQGPCPSPAVCSEHQGSFAREPGGSSGSG